MRQNRSSIYVSFATLLLQPPNPLQLIVKNYETPPALGDPDNSLTNCCQHLKNRYLQRGGMSVDTLWYARLRPLPGPPICGPKAHPLPLVICQTPMDLWIFKHLDAGAPTAALPPTCAGPVVSGNATISSTWPWPPRQNCRVREARDNAACFLQRLAFQQGPGAVHPLVGRN